MVKVDQLQETINFEDLKTTTADMTNEERENRKGGVGEGRRVLSSQVY